MAQELRKIVMKVFTMTDVKTKQKAIEAAADIRGIVSIAVDLRNQKLTVIGDMVHMDVVAVLKKMKKVGKVDIISVGPANEEKKEESKQDKDEKKEEKQPEDIIKEEEKEEEEEKKE